jgi:hypothetical protein
MYVSQAHTGPAASVFGTVPEAASAFGIVISKVAYHKQIILEYWMGGGSATAILAVEVSAAQSHLLLGTALALLSAGVLGCCE